MAPAEELAEALSKAKAAVEAAGESWESAPGTTSADASGSHRRPSASDEVPGGATNPPPQTDVAPAAGRQDDAEAQQASAVEGSEGDTQQVYDGVPLVKEATELKERANAFVKREKHQEAVKLYEKGLEVLKRSEGHPMLREEFEQVKALRAVLHCNIAQCMLSLELYRRAIDAATSCLELDKENTKALHRRSRAYESLREWEDALRDLLALKKLGGGGIDPKKLEKRCEELYEKQIAENKAVNEMAKNNEDLFVMKERFEEVLEKYDLGDGHAAPLVTRWLLEDDDIEQTIDKVAKQWEMSREEAGHFAKWIKKGLDMGVIPKPAQGPLPPGAVSRPS
mmetsp:Transcript_84950/g.245626  ORF Transcript_84950/g.245626 Transcript_84950/m.245626 type:complete len:339 (+) Transcript_84950:49-1065(+)